jgi:antitoxin HigA-1
LPGTRIERIASEHTDIAADTALRLAKAVGKIAQLWLNLRRLAHCSAQRAAAS